MVLFRGENIANGNPNRVDLLKRSLEHGFPTDLANRGDRYRVQKLGFFSSTIKHVADNNLGPDLNGSKHFISFSTNRVQAEYYATSYFSGGQLKDNRYSLDEKRYSVNSAGYGDTSIWDQTGHLRIELDITGAKPIHTSVPFVYTLTFNNGTNRLLAWDVVAFLQNQKARIGDPSQKLKTEFADTIERIEKALGYAETDSEWLVTSLDVIGASADGTAFRPMIPNSPILRVLHHL